ncbi:Gfo/Idh/MocA family protein [Pseudalkalibacillus caeni]|uniref:Gfo/Idh/MocA family oxidoreductase n=1 Tax=Exobacillus caeni TaxID=2574798 RepID=A0A5R9FCW6_9BACL|nr:Gfo/Idh/MocA family oxidoreductase [Pseudalkalibacillus caeni]TLS38394.1 Gfo/Idh/MocA family oxidoreductase [Pseudalkalibacillus caeni]
MLEKTGVGIIGCGNISSVYITNFIQMEEVELVSVADLDMKKAERRAKEFNIKNFEAPQDLISRSDIDIIVNLTTPEVHAEVIENVLLHGKHVYVEKPLAVELEDAQKVIDLARRKQIRIGCAPDTFLGGAAQTCRKIIDNDEIGMPIGAHAFMLCPGHESWHPDPGFYYARGAGPLFDMGPYYLTNLIALFGSVQGVVGMAKKTYDYRKIKSKPRFGEKIKVETPTHINGILNFSNGMTASLTTSFDVWHTTLPYIEVYGTKGTMLIPDPNSYGGEIKIKKEGDSDWKSVPIEFPYTENDRGIGVLDLIRSIKRKVKHRANASVGMHVLEIMHGLIKSAEEKKFVSINSTCERPPIMDDVTKGGL